jgi:repressor LexA
MGMRSGWHIFKKSPQNNKRFFIDLTYPLLFGFCLVYTLRIDVDITSLISPFMETLLQQPLTKKQKNILDYINQFISENGYSPSYREIAKNFSISSPATIYEHIKTLKEKGYIRSEGHQARALELISELFSRAISLPLVGVITAGQPIEAIEEKETMAVPADLVVDNQNSYILKVKGRSMIDDGILDGDFVVVERNPSPRNGDVVVALLDNAYATLKRFYREPSQIRLQPANSEMNPIFCKDVIIQGVVRAVVRKFQTA